MTLHSHVQPSLMKRLSSTTRHYANRECSNSLRLLAVLGALAALALPLAAEAQGKKRDKGRTISFEDDVIETTYLRPEGTVVEGINKNKRRSLIKIRLDFFAEIKRSAEDL